MMLVDKQFVCKLPSECTRLQGWLDGQIMFAIILLNILGWYRVIETVLVLAEYVSLRPIFRPRTTVVMMAKKSPVYR